MIIYKATNLINEKIYIGMTTNTLEFRKSQHKRSARSIKCKNTYFYNAINKYGFDNFEFIIIDKDEILEALNEKEAFWITFFNSTNKEIGYNLDSGGNTNKKQSSTRKKISETQKRVWKNKSLVERNIILATLKKATLKWVLQCHLKRVKIVCEFCKQEFFLAAYMSKGRRFCSKLCSVQVVALENLKKANEVNRQNLLSNDLKIQSQIKCWAKHNIDFIKTVKLNNSKPLFEKIRNDCNFKIKDSRTICRAFCKSNSKKMFILTLKDFIENIC